VKGNMGLAMKLDTVLKSAKSAPAPKAAAPAAAAPVSKSGSVAVPGFESSATFVEIQTGIASLPQSVKEATVKKVKVCIEIISILAFLFTKIIYLIL
jgi:hypothetical protein